MTRIRIISGEGARVKRPLTWVILRQGRNLADSWGVGVDMLWLCLCSSHFFPIPRLGTLRLQQRLNPQGFRSDAG